MVPWVITRERDDAKLVVDGLRARGLDALCIPGIARTPLPWPASLDLPTGLFFLTSPFAARLTMARIGTRARDYRFAATAPATFEVVHRAGVEPTVHAPGGSGQLARAVLDADIRGTPVLYPTSTAGLEQPEQARAVQTLASVGVVCRAAVYETAASPDLDFELRGLRGAPYCAAFFSPSAVEAYAGAVSRGAPPPIFSVCIGESTLRAYDDARIAAAPTATLIPRHVDVVEFIADVPQRFAS